MRMLVVIGLIFLLTDCQKQSQQKTSEAEILQESIDISSFSGDWQMLTERSDSLVIYRPCDADNVMVQLHADTLVIGWGQDASGGIVNSFQQQPDGRFSVNLKSLDSDYSQNIMVQFEDQSHGLARWWLWEDGSSALFVHSNHKNEHTFIEQPCRECWEDCPDE